MTETPSIAWKRFAIEAPVIVISILLAFAIDAWWGERNDRKAESLLLERLQADFIEIRSALRLVAEEHHEAGQACIFFMNMSVGEALPATAKVDRMVALVFLASRTFNPGSGAIASFHGSEGARLVHNQALADKLLAWSGLVEELQEEEANLQKGVTERWSPYIASRVNVGPYVAAFGELSQGLRLPEHVSTPVEREPLVVDDVFINHVLDRFKWQQLALRDIEPIHDAVENILTLIEGELSD
jgi:hypothetical protein